MSFNFASAEKEKPRQGIGEVLGNILILIDNGLRDFRCPPTIKAVLHSVKVIF